MQLAEVVVLDYVPFIVLLLGPVSYTHLDVYKRQPLRSTQPTMSPLPKEPPMPLSRLFTYAKGGLSSKKRRCEFARPPPPPSAFPLFLPPSGLPAYRVSWKVDVYAGAAGGGQTAKGDGGRKPMETYKQEFIEFMVESDVLKFGDFTLKSGRKSPFFMNAGAYLSLIHI